MTAWQDGGLRPSGRSATRRPPTRPSNCAWFPRLRRAANAVTLRFRNQPCGIVGQQEAAGDEVVGGFLEGCHISFLGRIAFLDRWPRIADRKALLFGRCKRNEAAA